MENIQHHLNVCNLDVSRMRSVGIQSANALKFMCISN